MGFDEAESLKPTQAMTLTTAQATDASGPLIQTNFVAFQRVTNLTIFIENNQEGGDITEVSSIVLHGNLAH